MDFEKKLNRLNEISKNLKSDDLNIDLALKEFEEGMKLYKELKDYISKIEGEYKDIVDEFGKEDEWFFKTI